MSYNIYTGMLKMMDTFQHSGERVHLRYGYDQSAADMLDQKYGIRKISGEGTTITKALNIVRWLSGHIFHKGEYNNSLPQNAIHLLEYAYDGGMDHGIDCNCLAVILTECCLAIGIRARTVFIMPFSPYDDDNHVVTEVYIDELDKWVMLDPTYNCYTMNANNIILNVLELRNELGNRKVIKFSDDISYNGQPYDINELKEYYAKDLFYFFSIESQEYQSDMMKDRIVIVAPFGYDVKKSLLINLDYRMEAGDELKQIEKAKNQINQLRMIYIADNDFIRKPV